MDKIPPRLIRRTMNDAVVSVVVCSLFGAAVGAPILTGGLLNLALKFSESQIAMVMSFGQLFLPMQMLGAYVQQRWFSRKRFWATFTAIYYALFGVLTMLVWSWSAIPMAAAVALFIFFFAAAQVAAQLVGSVYVAWLGDLVPPRDSNSFWNRRQGWALLSGMVAGVGMGYFVDFLGRDRALTYGIVLAIGVVAGLVSLLVQLRIPGGGRAEARGTTFGEQWRELRGNGAFQTLTAFFALQAFVGVLSCTFQFVYLTGKVEAGMAGMSMATAQILLAFANLVGFGCGYLFRVIGNKYGRKPILMLCSAIKGIEFILWGFVFAQPTQTQALLWALPVFFLAGVDNMGLITAQFSLLTGVTSQRVRGVAIGVFYAILGVSGFVGTLLSGFLYEHMTPMTVGGFHFGVFNLLAFLSAVGFFLSMLILLRFHEDGAVATSRVVRMLFTNNPIRSVYQPYVLSQPLSEASRVSTLKRADGNLSAAEVAKDFYNPSSRVRQCAMLTVLRDADKLSPVLEEELIRLLDMPELGLQAMAAGGLGLARSRRAVPELLRRLDDRDLALSQACVFALGMICSVAAEKELRTLLESERFRPLWANAAEALGKISGENQTRLIYRAYRDEFSEVLQVQYLLALSRSLRTDKAQIHPVFEKEELQDGSEIERLLKNLTNSPLYAPAEAKRSFETLMGAYEAGQGDRVLSHLLLRLLKRYDLAPEADEEEGQFLSRRFLAAGQLREAVFNQDGFESVALWLLMHFWTELHYAPENANRFVMLAALLSAEALVKRENLPLA